MRAPIDHLSNLDRTSIKHLSKFYRTPIETLSNIYRTSIEHPFQNRMKIQSPTNILIQKKIRSTTRVRNTRKSMANGGPGHHPLDMRERGRIPAKSGPRNYCLGGGRTKRCRLKATSPRGVTTVKRREAPQGPVALVGPPILQAPPWGSTRDSRRGPLI